MSAAGYSQGEDISREGQLTTQSTRAYAEELIPFLRTPARFQANGITQDNLKITLRSTALKS